MLEAIVLAQIKFETDRLLEETPSGMSLTTKIQADRLRDNTKVTVPDAHKTLDASERS